MLINTYWKRKMPKIVINGKEIEFEQGMTFLQACELANVEQGAVLYM